MLDVAKARSRRLTRSGDFERVYREGDSNGNRFLVLHRFPRGDAPDESPRIGVSVGKRVGGAVERNKVKRALREAIGGIEARLPQGMDFVIVARPDVAGLLEREGQGGVERELAQLVGEPDDHEGV